MVRTGADRSDGVRPKTSTGSGVPGRNSLAVPQARPRLGSDPSPRGSPRAAQAGAGQGVPVGKTKSAGTTAQTVARTRAAHAANASLAASGAAAGLEEGLSGKGEFQDSLAVFPPLLFTPPRWLNVCIGLFLLWMVLCVTIWKGSLEDMGVTSEDFLKYVSIPVVSTIFTYVHIWVALYLTFYPVNFVGCWQIPDTNVGCGWQGIIPNKAEKMARLSTQLMTTKLVSVKAIFSRIDGARLAQELKPWLEELIPKVVEVAANKEEKKWWRILPNRPKKRVYQKSVKESDKVVLELMANLKDNIEDVFDLEEMVVQALTSDPSLLNYIFIQSGYQELKLIRNNGALMGGVFGLLQVSLWIFWSAGWMLPTFGLVVGILTNWIALKIIFCPIEKKTFLGGRVVIQGMFLQRQQEVSAMYGKLVASNVLSAKNILTSVLLGPKAERLLLMLIQQISEATDSVAGFRKPLLQCSSKKHYRRFKKLVASEVFTNLPNAVGNMEKYVETAMDLETLLREEMSKLSPGEFERFLHPVFEEDEWKLVLMGGVLGIVVGCCQWWALGA